MLASKTDHSAVEDGRGVRKYVIRYNGQGSAYPVFAELSPLATIDDANTIANELLAREKWINEVTITPWYQGETISVYPETED